MAYKKIRKLHSSDICGSSYAFKTSIVSPVCHTVARWPKILQNNSKGVPKKVLLVDKIGACWKFFNKLYLSSLFALQTLEIAKEQDILRFG